MQAAFPESRTWNENAHRYIRGFDAVSISTVTNNHIYQ